MSEAFDQWMKRTCCCRHPDRQVCEELRYGLRVAIENDHEGCECICHEQDWDEEESRTHESH